MNNSKTADARIQRWKRWWDVGDHYVRCTQCGARQLIEDAEQPFNPLHSTDCPLRSDLPQHAWLALKALLQEWQQETSDEDGSR